MSHGAQLASCFHLLSEHFEYGLIGSSDDYSHLTIPWGSSPCIDFLFSTGRLKIVHDGSGYSRTEKVERIGKNEQVKKYLKVCWEKGLEDNCGRCEKCLRTRLNFLAVGIDNPSCFNGKLNFDDFKRIKLKNKGIIEEVEGIIDYVKKNNIQVNWINKIERIIIKNKIRNKIRKIRQSLKS